MDLVGGESSCGVDGIIVSSLDVREAEVPIVLAFVDHHGKHLGDGVVEAFDTAIGLRVVRASMELSGAEKLVDSVREFRRKLGAIV